MPSDRSLRNQNHKYSSQNRVTLQAHSKGSLRKRLQTPKATEAFGQAIGNELQGGEIIALTGELGAGKTLFVRGIAAGVGIPPDQVTSPTFTLIHEYQGRLRLVHADLYRVENEAELDFIGLEEYYDASTIVVAEWADRMGNTLPIDHLDIHLAHSSRRVRTVTITPRGPQSQSLFEKLTQRASH